MAAIDGVVGYHGLGFNRFMQSMEKIGENGQISQIFIDFVMEGGVDGGKKGKILSLAIKSI